MEAVPEEDRNRKNRPKVGDTVKVFISWSGDKSLAVAEVLKSWLPSVLQALDEVWLSDDDIRSGANWSATIGEKLSTTDFGIVCVTQHNQDRPWINFEAGAISKLVGGAVPLLIDFPNKSDLNAGPMSQLQVRTIDRTDIERLIRDMNAKLDKPLASDVLKTSFSRAYGELEDAPASDSQRRALRDRTRTT
jgi:TIR domain